jgi:Domain of unknown function (DUF222)/HNH endonuclease
MSIAMVELVQAFSRLISAGITIDDADQPVVEQALRDCARISSFAESVRLRAITRVDVFASATSSPDAAQSIVEITRGSRRQAQAAQKRAATTSQMTSLGDALERGAICSDHVDAVSQTLSRMDPVDRSKLANDERWIAEMAARSTPEQLAKKLQSRARELAHDDGVKVLERQRRAAFLRSWTDKDTGMVCLYGQFDPESGATLIGRLRNAAEALFHDRVPDTCPLDERKQDHLRALALLHLTEGKGTSSGRPDLTVVIDLQTLLDGAHAQSRIEVDGGVTLPVETIRRMACFANIIPAVLGGNGVLLDLGRSQRLATGQQRTAMRAMYSTCGAPGCGVAFEHCTVHHINYWRNGGPSDMGNLIPLCSKHHHLAHEGGWQLELSAERYLTVTKPDGSRQTHPPPLARAG